MDFFNSFFDSEYGPHNIDKQEDILRGLRCVLGVYPNVIRCERVGCEGGRFYYLRCPTYREYCRRLRIISDL